MSKKNNSDESKPKRSRKQSGARDKGHQYERDIRLDLIAAGFTKCKTSRSASRLYDDCGIDHWGTMLPDGTLLLTQAKAGYARNRPKADVEFKNQLDKVSRYFPPGSPETNPNNIQALFHKLNGYKDYNHTVTVTYKDFLKLLKVYVRHTKILQKQQPKPE